MKVPQIQRLLELLQKKAQVESEVRALTKDLDRQYISAADQLEMCFQARVDKLKT